MKILRPEVLKCIKHNVPGKHGAFELVDDLFLMSFNVTDEEFNFICANASAEESNIFVNFVSGAENSLQLFTQIRKALVVRNKYLDVFKINIV
jgi:hypothetical protein